MEEWWANDPVSSENTGSPEWWTNDPTVDNQMMGMGFPQQNPETVPEAGYVQRKRAIEDSGIPFDDTPFPMMVRADLEASRHNEDELSTKFYKQYPKGNLRSLDVEGLGPIYFGQTSEEGKYRLLNPVGLDTSDIGAALANSPEIAGSILAAVATGGKSIKLQMAADALGPVVGGMLKEFGEYLRGVQKDTPGEIAGRLGVEAGLNVVGGRVAGTVTGGVNLGRHGAILDENQASIVRAAKEEGINLPSPDRLSSNAVVKRFGAQSRASSKVLRENDLDTLLDVSQAGDELRGQGAPAAGRELRDNIIPGQLAERTQQQTSLLPNMEGNDFVFGGKGLKAGIADYIKSTKKTVNELYDAALNKAPNGVSLDITKPIDEANTLLKGIQGITQEGKLETVVNIDGELSRIAKAISGLADIQDFDTVKQLRTELFQLKNASRLSGLTRQESQAKKLYDSLTESMDNPVGEYDPSFTRLYGRARKYNYGRERRIEKEVIQGVANTENPAKLAKSLAQPGEYDNLLVLKKSMKPENWEQFRASFRRDLLFDAQEDGWTSPNNISSQIARWRKEDPKGLRLLLSPEEQRLYVRVGDEINKIANSESAAVLDDVFEGGKIAYRLIHNKGPDEMARIIDELGGRGSEGHRLLKESLADYLFAGSVRREKETSRLLIDSNDLTRKVQSLFSDMRVRGVMEELYSPDELKRILNMEKVLSVFRGSTSDAGASLEVAQDISALKNITRGDVLGTMKGAHGLLFNRMLGRAMLTDGMERFLLGTGKQPLSGTRLRALTVGLIQARDSIEQLSGDVKSDLHDKGLPKFREFLDKYSNYSIR